MLREAARACDEARSGVRAELLARAAARAPHDAALAGEAIAAAVSVGEWHEVEATARRVLGGLSDAGARVAVLRGAARAVIDDAAAARLALPRTKRSRSRPTTSMLLEVAARACDGAR